MKKCLLNCIALTLAFVFLSCGDDDAEPTFQEEDFSLGLNSGGDFSQVPRSVGFGVTSSGNLPSSVDLTSKLPPVGDQEQYGTCVTWAVAYHAMTAIDGMANSLSTADLSNPSNQFSAKDLFIAIPDNQKGADCNGTDFVPTLDVLQQRGVATEATVPYTGMGDCRQSNLESSWTSEAAANKIDYWRVVDGDVTGIKQQLSTDRPVIFGAKLDDDFMSWNNNQVYSGYSSFDNVGIHAYHAMVVIGYDDSRGTGGAFLVRNSWGDFWGNDGDIWVDYNFFINEFVMPAGSGLSLFMATVEQGDTTPPDPDDDNSSTSGVELVSWVFSDVWNDSFSNTRERTIAYNIYNIGDADATPDKDWGNVYIYANAYDAADYGFIFYDVFTDDYSEFIGPGEADFLSNYLDVNEDIYVINDVLRSNSSFAVNEDRITYTYEMPSITGDYYLILVSDAWNVFDEQNEEDNLFYTTEAPINFFQGQGRLAGRANGNDLDFKTKLTHLDSEARKFRTAVTQQNRNAYRTEEIIDFLKTEKGSGAFDRKLREFSMQYPGKTNVRRRSKLK